MGLTKWQKISKREKIQLGYTSTSNPNSNSSSRRNSSVDFSDVFGGPPRISGQNYYYNEFDHMNCSNDDVDNDMDSSSIDDAFRSSLLGFTEKPVFGDQIGGRKRYPNEDFYGDIFGGDQPLLSCTLSPRVHMHGRSPFGSGLGSRPLSPASELSASPAKFSLPGRISNTEYTTSTSMNQSSKSSGRYLSRLRQTFQRISNYQPSSLSRQISIHSKESTNDSKFNSPKNEAEFVNNLNDNIQFHFSIYKWPNKGIPITLSSRKRSPSRSNERSNDFLVMVNVKDDKTIEDDSFSVSKRRMPSITQVRGTNVVECKLEGDIRDQDVLESTSKELKSSRANTSSKMTKLSTRPLASLFGDGKEESEANKVVKESKRKEKKKQILNDIFSIHPKMNKSKVHEVYQEAKNENDKNEVTEKVKDFVKMFNQETPSKVESNNYDGLGSSRNWRWKDKDSSKITIEMKNDEVKTSSSRDHDETWLESIEMVDLESYLSEEQHAVNGNSNISEPKIESTKASSPNIIVISVEGEVGKEMLQDKDTELATESQDETQSYERKVKQWSKGKEGNIRALLSTMQFVLWPNSGWKPIPLVDIIEANAVKKSYQRALLCLHPDKLQQKGATPYQKFIAERVFDILQEAWEQFNSLGLL